ncbi:MAG: ParB/RepB/Spo0J family partition protein [Coriobacteriales bacterium]
MNTATASAAEHRAEPKTESLRESGMQHMDRQLDYAYQRDSGTNAVAANKSKLKLVDDMGIDFLDARKLVRNPKNTYSIDDASIESLADMIYTSSYTAPIAVREIVEEDEETGTKELKYQIVDGERRWMAHCWLGKKISEEKGAEEGEKWYMIPARVFRNGQLADEDADFIMHSANVGQRELTDRERSEGIAAVSEKLLKLRDLGEGVGKETVNEVVGKMFGISTRTAAMERNIGLNLSDEGKDLLDAGKIGKVSADAIASLKGEDQAELIAAVNAGTIKNTEDIKQAVKRKKSGASIAKSEKLASDHARSALKALKKALAADGIVELGTIMEIRSLANQLREKAIEETESE